MYFITNKMYSSLRCVWVWTIWQRVMYQSMICSFVISWFSAFQTHAANSSCLRLCVWDRQNYCIIIKKKKSYLLAYHPLLLKFIWEMQYCNVNIYYNNINSVMKLLNVITPPLLYTLCTSVLLFMQPCTRHESRCAKLRIKLLNISPWDVSCWEQLFSSVTQSKPLG